MITMTGKAVFGGIARGYISYYHRDEIVVNKHKVNDPELEYKKYSFAKEASEKELGVLYDQASCEIGENDAQIFYIHQLILNDSQYENFIKDFILSQRFNCEYAVARTAQQFAKMLGDMDNDYIKARIADVNDVSERVLRHLQNRSTQEFRLTRMSIICSDDLMPSETVALDKTKVAAFCTSLGSTNSHTAILARTMNIPAIIGLGDVLTDEYDGKYAIVDGYSGILYIEPDSKTIKKLEHKEAEEGRKKELLRRLRGRKNITRDGREVEVYANIGSLSDVSFATENDAGGVGLFRSEFMYIGRDDYPDEELLFYNYRRVLEDMKGKKVVIRTLDIGVDNNIDYFGLDKELNPALGYRAIRICLERTEIFKTQLRALYRASIYGNLSILIPMVIDPEEIRQVKALIDEVKLDLLQNKIPFSDNVKIGAMIETPAAVMLSDLFAREVDFFSIGTNDLEQYTLAIDRQNPHFEQIAPSHHLPVLRMIKVICDNAHANGIKVCICGELGADLSLTEIFLDMHVDELSVAPSQILPVRRMIRSLNLSDRKQIHDNIQMTLKY